MGSAEPNGGRTDGRGDRPSDDLHAVAFAVSPSWGWSPGRTDQRDRSCRQWRITQVRLPHVKDIFHAAQVGGMDEVDRAGKELTGTLAGVLGDHCLTNVVIEVVWVVACDAILFGFVEPDDYSAVVLVGLRSHNHRTD